jgi:molybdopterin converting factor small subunit
MSFAARCGLIVSAQRTREDRAVAFVRLHGTLKQLAGGLSEHPIDASTVAELLLEMERTQPAVSGWILDERGHVRRHINVFVNGEYGREDTPVGPDDRIDVLPAISGG